MVLQNFLGFYTLRDGTIISALIVGICSMYYLQYFVSKSVIYLTSGAPVYARPGVETIFHDNFWVSVLSSLYLGALFGSSLAVLFGIKKERMKYLVAFMVLLIVNDLLVIIFMVLHIVRYGFHLPVFFLYADVILVNSYFCFVAYSFSYVTGHPHSVAAVADVAGRRSNKNETSHPV